MSKFEDVVRQRQCVQKFQDNCISKDQLDVMIKTYNSNKFKFNGLYVNRLYILFI